MQRSKLQKPGLGTSMLGYGSISTSIISETNKLVYTPAVVILEMLRTKIKATTKKQYPTLEKSPEAKIKTTQRETSYKNNKKVQ